MKSGTDVRFGSSRITGAALIRDGHVLHAEDAQTVDGRLFHYRDSNGLEADAIIELPDGRWAAFEIKLGSSPKVVDEAAGNLRKLRAVVAGEAPVALGVITGTGYSLTRPDGVLQIAIGALTA